MRKHLIWFCVVLASLLVWLAMRDRGPAATGSLRPHSETRALERGDGPAPLDSPAETGTGSARDLAAESEARAATQSDPEVAATPSGATVVVELRIVDIDGGPIPEAEVETWGSSPRAASTSDAQGVARLAFPSLSARNVYVKVRADGYLHYRNKIFLGQRPPIVLYRIALVAGSVVDAQTGAAIAGARVRVPHERCAEDCPALEAVTDAGGRFGLAGVPAGVDVKWIATAEGYVGASSKLPVPADATDTSLDIALVPGLRLAGRVVDLATSLPVAGANVRQEFDFATSDADGQFALHVGGVLHPQVYVEHPEYASLSARIDRIDPDGRPIELTLVPLVAITGQVRDAMGQPIAGATARVGRNVRTSDVQDAQPLSALPASWSVLHPNAESTTEADGRFRVVGAVAWRSGQALWINADGYRDVQVALPPCPLPGEERVDVVMEPVAAAIGYATITGTLTVNGQPAAGYVGWSGNKYVRTTSGFFRLERAEAGQGRLFALLDDYENVHESVSLTIEPGAAVHHDFAFEFPMLPISGHVRFSDGRPAAGETVLAVVEEHMFMRSAITDDRGAFTITVRDVPEPYSLHVDRGGLHYRREGVAAGESGVDIDLGVMGALRVRAVDARSRQPILDASFQITPLFEHGRGGSAKTAPYASGWRGVELVAGPWRVLALAGNRGFAGAWQTAGIVPGETTELELPLQRGVRVVLAGGTGSDTPLAHAWMVEESLAEEAERLLRDPSGEETVSETLVSGVTIFRNFTIREVPRALEGVPPGRYQLLSAPGFLSPFVDLVFEPNVLLVPDDVESVRFDVVWRKASEPPR